MFSVSNSFPVWPATSVLTLACMAGETPDELNWADAHRRRGDGEVHGRDFLGPRSLVSAAFTVALMPLRRKHFFKHLADAFDVEPLAGKRP